MNWKLTDSVYAYISYTRDRVFIANPEKKKFYGAVKKISGCITTPILVQNENFNIKFSSGNIYIKHEALGEKYYILGNCMVSEIINILSEASITNGENNNIAFSFNLEYPEKTMILFKDSELYRKCEKDLLRRVSLSLYTKTSKLKPGYLYNSENYSLIYLGTVISHKILKKNSQKYYQDSENTRLLHAFCCEDYSGNISSIFDSETQYIDLTKLSDNLEPEKNFIYLSESQPKLVEGDKRLEINENFNITDTWELYIDNILNKGKEYISQNSDLVYYPSINRLLEYFDITSKISVPKDVIEKIKPKLLEILETNISYYILKHYGLEIHSYGCNIKSTDTLENQASCLIEYLRTYIFSKENYNGSFFTSMLTDLFEINLIDLCKTLLTDFKNNEKNLLKNMSENFKALIDNFPYYEYRNPENYNTKIDFVYCNEKKRTFENFLGDNKYCNIIKEIFKEAIESGGENVSYFCLTNIGTQKSIVLEYIIQIKLDDIKRHLGIESIMDLDSELQVEFLKNKINNLTILTRDNIKIDLCQNKE